MCSLWKEDIKSFMGHSGKSEQQKRQRGLRLPDWNFKNHEILKEIFIEDMSL